MMESKWIGKVEAYAIVAKIMDISKARARAIVAESLETHPGQPRIYSRAEAVHFAHWHRRDA